MGEEAKYNPPDENMSSLKGLMFRIILNQEEAIAEVVRVKSSS